MSSRPTRAEGWVKVGDAFALVNTTTLHLCDVVRLFEILRLDGGRSGNVVKNCSGVEFRIEISTGGTDTVDVTFYRTPQDGTRDPIPMGSTHGAWDHALDTSATPAEDNSSRRIDWKDCGSGVTCGIQKNDGVTTDMTVTVWARRDRVSYSY